MEEKVEIRGRGEREQQETEDREKLQADRVKTLRHSHSKPI